MSLRPDTLADATAPATRLDGAGLRRWAQRAATELQRRRSEINGLNVYPVPDSDTGSNMSFTMDSARRYYAALLILARIAACKPRSCAPHCTARWNYQKKPSPPQ